MSTIQPTRLRFGHLEIPVARPPNPHRYWLIGPKAFETVRNKLTNGHEPVVIETAASPITACDAEHRPAALRHEPGGAAAVGLLGNQRLPDTAADTDVANSDDSAAPYNLRAKSHTKLGPLDPRDEGRVKEGKQMVIDRKARSANHAARIIAERDASHNDQAKEAMRDRIGRAIREALNKSS